MKEKEQIKQEIEKIMTDLDNIVPETPSPHLVRRILARLESAEKSTVFHPISGWLRTVLVGAMVALNIFLCYLAITESGKALKQRTEALDRMAMEYEMISSDDLFFKR